MIKLQERYPLFFNQKIEELEKQLEMLPPEQLWQVKPGIINSCGVLVQHLTGNLNHYIGAELGNTGYIRNRELEFQKSDKSREELLEELSRLREMLDLVLTNLDKDDFAASYPGKLPFKCTIEEALVHLYGHFNYHLGQFNYLRRILCEKG